VAFIYPFANVKALIEAANTHGPSPPTRYVLVTGTGAGSLDTLWRAYEDLPSDAQLQTDLAGVFSGATQPVASVDLATKKVTVMVGAKGG
jgi:hypothetical protein